MVLDVSTVEPMPDLDYQMSDAEFWAARPVLAHILEFSRARMAGPWAVLGVTLARTVSAVEPTWQLPPIIGGPMSINLFAALVGPSGGGKGAAENAARDAVLFSDGRLPIDIDTFTVGSGEGIARTFEPAGDEDDAGGRTRALFTVAEVDTLTALGKRTGSTLLPELRKVYSGESIGFQNAGKTTRLVIPAHAYRAALTMGVQPAKAGPLIYDADGGTPQRFVWLPVDDPDAPDVEPEAPEPWTVTVPRWESTRHISVPDVARAEIVAHRRAVLRGEPVNSLDGHAMLCRLKVAAALAMLEGRASITDDDWSLADVVMRKSTRTRMMVELVLAEQSRAENRARAEAEGERAVIAETVKESSALSKACDRVLVFLGTHGLSTPGHVRRKLRSNHRPYFEDAVIDLIAAGKIRQVFVDGSEHLELTGNVDGSVHTST